MKKFIVTLTSNEKIQKTVENYQMRPHCNMENFLLAEKEKRNRKFPSRITW